MRLNALRCAPMLLVAGLCLLPVGQARAQAGCATFAGDAGAVAEAAGAAVTIAPGGVLNLDRCDDLKLLSGSACVMTAATRVCMLLRAGEALPLSATYSPRGGDFIRYLAGLLRGDPGSVTGAVRDVPATLAARFPQGRLLHGRAELVFAGATPDAFQKLTLIHEEDGTSVDVVLRPDGARVAGATLAAGQHYEWEAVAADGQVFRGLFEIAAETLGDRVRQEAAAARTDAQLPPMARSIGEAKILASYGFFHDAERALAAAGLR